jgi:hypothetical protein
VSSSFFRSRGGHQLAQAGQVYRFPGAQLAQDVVDQLVNLVLGHGSGQALGARQFTRQFFAFHRTARIIPDPAARSRLEFQAAETLGFIGPYRL